MFSNAMQCENELNFSIFWATLASQGWQLKQQAAEYGHLHRD
jgi:hypothetical protein